MATYNILFNPVLDDESDVQRELRTYANNFPIDDTTNITYHPIPGKDGRDFIKYNYETDLFEKARIEKFLRDEKDYIDQSDFGAREDNILERITVMEEYLPQTYQDRTKLVFKQLTGENHIRTRVNNHNNCMITLSKYNGPNKMIFDTVICSDFVRNNERVSLYFGHKFSDFIPIVHTGDQSGDNNALLQSMKVDKPASSTKFNVDQLSGVVYFHAYKGYKFRQITYCEPNICIVDDNPDTGMVTMYVYHFNMAPAIVGDSKKAAVARFKYNPAEDYIDWVIPTQPVYFDDNHSVGFGLHYDTKCIAPSTFIEPQPHSEPMVGNINQQPPEVHHRDYYDNEGDVPMVDASQERLPEEFMEVTDADVVTLTENDSIVIAQESILNTVDENGKRLGDIRTAQFVEKYMRDDRVKLAATFHRNISVVNENANNRCSRYVNAKMSLPIGGFSPVSGILPILQLCEPPRDGRGCRRILNALRTTYEDGAPTVIVFVSDEYLSGNIPKIHYKLNAIYVVVCKRDRTDEKVENVLADVDTSMAIALQGPVSVTLAYYNDKFYFIRGVWNLQFGDHVSADLRGAFPIRAPLHVSTKEAGLIFSPINGRVVCQWSATDASMFLNTIYHYAAQPNTMIRDTLKFMLSQLEAVIHPDELLKLQETCLDNLEKMNRSKLTKGRVWSKLASDDVLRTYISTNPLDDRTASEEYNRLWLNAYIYDILGTDSFNATSAQIQICNNAHTILKKIERTDCIYEYIFEILETIVPVKGSYGKRSRSARKALRSRNIDQNVEAVKNATSDTIIDFFDEKCSEEGILIFALDLNTLKSNLEAGSNEDTNQSVFRESILYHGQGVGNMQAGYFDSCFPGSDLSFEYGRETLFSAPILDEFIPVFSSIYTIRNYDWRKTVPNGPADVARILFRKTVKRLLNEMGIEAEANSGIVGRACLMILSSLITKLSDMCTLKSDPNCTSTKRLKAVYGLYLSFMASGKEIAFVQSYRLLTEEDPYFTLRDFIHERNWISTMTYSAEKLQIPALGFTTKVTNYALNYIREIKIKEEEPRYTKEERRQVAKSDMYQRAKHDNEARLPIVLHILGYEFGLKDRLLFGREDAKSKMAKAKRGTLEYGPDDVAEIPEPELARLEEEADRLLGLRRKDVGPDLVRKVDKEYVETRSTDYPDQEFCERLKELYDRGLEVNKDLSEKSHLFGYIAKFLGCDDDSVEKSKAWCQVASVAFDTYIKKSNVLLSEWIDMVARYKEQKRSPKDRRDYFKMLRNLRGAMLRTALLFRNPFYENYCTFIFKPILRDLITCDSSNTYNKVIEKHLHRVYTTHEHFKSETMGKISERKIVIEAPIQNRIQNPNVKTLSDFLIKNCNMKRNQIK